MLHAYRNPTRVFDLDDLTRLVDAGMDGGLLEVGVADADGIDNLAVPPHPNPARLRGRLHARRAPLGRHTLTSSSTACHQPTHFGAQ